MARPRRTSQPTNRTPERGPSRGAALLGAALLFASAAAAASPLPAHPRRLEYRVAWNGIPAAGASVAIIPGERGGRASLEVEARARTNAFVDLFWTYRGTARTTLLADDLAPVEFVYQRTMAGKPYLTWVDFDRATRRARSVYLRGSKRRELDVDAHDAVDPITAVFRARLSGAGPGDVRRYEVFTGEASYRVQLTVVGPDEIEVPAGRFRALRVVPELWKLTTSPEPDTRLRGATIWVADDSLRTLLRIRSEVFVGAVTLDLVKIDA
jgi:hypothetical protein